MGERSGCQKQFYARVFLLIRQYQMLVPGDRVVVGVSGGVDSVVLLAVLHHLRKPLGIELHSAHLNHQLRGAEAARDAAFVREFSEKLGIPCVLEARDVAAFKQQQKLSPQDAARQLRYAFFESVAEQVQAQKIATAHTADDQAETVLLGLIRGVGLHGLGGIQPVWRRRLIRPFLTTTRAQIEAYARDEGLRYVVDSSNACRKYLRNAVRLDLLPLLQQQFTPAIVNRLTAYAQVFREDADFIDRIATERYALLCENVGGRIKINLDLFAKEYITIQRAVIYQIFAACTGTKQRLETRHARAVIDLFTRRATGKRLSLPGGVLAWRQYAWGYLAQALLRPEDFAETAIELALPGATNLAELSIETDLLTGVPAELFMNKAHAATDAELQYLDYDRITPPVRVRYHLPGDRFRPLGMHGQKTVKKFFIDRKIPADKRKHIPLVEDQDGIFWVVGYSIAERVKITRETQKVLRCRVRQHTKGQK